MQRLFRSGLLKHSLPGQLRVYFLRRKSVLYGMLLPLVVLLGSTITALGMYVEWGDLVMADQPLSNQTPYNPPSAAGQSQGQSVNPQSFPPDQPPDQTEESSEPTSIPIGVPMSPEEYRELKERATHPTPPDQESNSVDSQTDSVSVDTDESEQ